MDRFRFRCEGLAMDSAGQIVDQRGPFTVIEGIAQDAGFYFVKKKDKARRFDSKVAADAYVEKKLAEADQKKK